MTDDLMRALTRLAERGDPIGVEALVERIDGELASRAGAPWPERIRARGGRGRPWLLAAALALAVVLVAAGLVVAVGSGTGGDGGRIGTSALTPDRLEVARRAVVGPAAAGPSLLVAAGDSLWAAGGADAHGTSTLFRLDPRTGGVRARRRIPGDALSLAPGFGSLWIVTADGGEGAPGRLVRVDERTGRVRATLELATPTGVATGAGAVWVTDATHGELDRVDPVTNRVAGRAPVPGASAVAVRGRLVYVAERAAGVVRTVDAGTLEPRTATSLNVAGQAITADELVTSGSNVWAVSAQSGEVTGFAAATVQLTPTIAVGGPVTAAAAGPGGGLWLAVRAPAGRFVGLVRPSGGRVVPAPGARDLASAAFATTRTGLWTLDSKTATLTLLEAR